MLKTYLSVRWLVEGLTNLLSDKTISFVYYKRKIIYKSQICNFGANCNSYKYVTTKFDYFLFFHYAHYKKLIKKLIKTDSTI